MNNDHWITEQANMAWSLWKQDHPHQDHGRRDAFVDSFKEAYKKGWWDGMSQTRAPIITEEDLEALVESRDEIKWIPDARYGFKLGFRECEKRNK